MSEHNDNTEIPKNVKIVMVVINRLGFPIVAFGMMWYLCNHTIASNTKVLTFLKASLDVHNRITDQIAEKLLGKRFLHDPRHSTEADDE